MYCHGHAALLGKNEKAAAFCASMLTTSKHINVAEMLADVSNLHGLVFQF